MPTATAAKVEGYTDEQIQKDVLAEFDYLARLYLSLTVDKQMQPSFWMLQSSYVHFVCER